MEDVGSKSMEYSVLLEFHSKEFLPSNQHCNGNGLGEEKRRLEDRYIVAHGIKVLQRNAVV